VCRIEKKVAGGWSYGGRNAQQGTLAAVEPTVAVASRDLSISSPIGSESSLSDFRIVFVGIIDLNELETHGNYGVLFVHEMYEPFEDDAGHGLS
jgi:hypothetical protein